MLDAKDIQLLQDMFKNVHQSMEALRTETRQEFGTLRAEILQQIGTLHTEMHRGLEKVRDDVIDVINDNVQPQFNVLNARVSRLERKLA